MPNLTIVGEAPSRSSDPKRPFAGASGRTLAKLAGLDGYEELAARASLANVLKRWPGEGFAGEKGSRFPIKKARRAASRMKFEDGHLVVLAGKRVADAFGIRFSDYFNWKILRRGGVLRWFVCVPHPSGCNRWFNYRKNVKVAERFFRELFAERAGLVEVPKKKVERKGAR